ncbi:MAG: acetylglutamate kinase [Verrucomicrobiales bacterium]|nr:acetylglutamate kinase [Verrucomicrobiales bacterium]|tara:strand:+ start:25002 stop:25889 length:888 start_codon:yes stop_codon:yes gene_type:complete
MNSNFQNHIEKADVLLEALPYLQEFRGKTFLIKVGGSAMDDPALVRRLLRDVVFMEVAGINPVIVHGGGKAISAAMHESGLEAKFVGGQRVTTDAAMEIVEKTLSGKINRGLVQGIESFGGRAIGVAGNETFIGQRLTGWSDEENREVELGRVGRVTGFDLSKIHAALASEIVPVVSPVASEEGTKLSLNVNADLAASALAAELKASKLVYLSDVLGLMRDPSDQSTLIDSLNVEEAEGLIGGGVISGGMIPKVRSSVEAINAGVGKIHMVDGRISHSLLLEIFTEKGIGTEIVK